MKRKIFAGLYCLLAAVAFVMDFGFFECKFTGRPLVYYTSLSNMACGVFMLASLVPNFQTGKQDPWPGWKFVFTVMILITTLVYNLLLNSHRSLFSYFADVKNALQHLILPVMFVLDWFFFYRRGTAKPRHALLTVLPPMIYAIYTVVRAAIIKAAGIPTMILYPYFFLNLDRLGWNGFSLWMAILLAGILALSYGLYALDRLLRPKVKI